MKQKKEVKKVESSKVTTKKTATKPVKETKTKNLMIIPPEQYFFLVNGVAIKTIFELAETLEHMADDVYGYHVNDQKNDFANWIKYVFNELALAEQLYHTKDKKATEYILLKFCARKKINHY